MLTYAALKREAVLCAKATGARRVTSTKVQILTSEALLLQFDVTIKAEATIKIASLPPVYADVC